MSLTIDLYCNDGSPIGLIPADIYGRGVGGAELAMMTWADVMAKRGHTVTIYNDPSAVGKHNGVMYLPRGHFKASEYRDVFIAFRSPCQILRIVNAGLRVHWSTDQQTIGDFARDIVPFVDKIICISPYHAEYYKHRYGAHDKVSYIDLGVRLAEYQEPVEKIPGRCIFCSVPDRGLAILRQVWPRIKEEVPEASLVITSDYRLWGAPGPNNHQHRMDWLNLEDVIFLGAIPREQLVKEQLAAVCQPYPCIYDELHCISAAECQVAGAVPVTSTIGALETTNEWGVQIPGSPYDGQFQEQFIAAVVDVLAENEPASKMQKAAKKRFNWETLCDQWEQVFEGVPVG